MILCIHDVTEVHRCKRRNENRVIYHHFVQKNSNWFCGCGRIFVFIRISNFRGTLVSVWTTQKNENREDCSFFDFNFFYPIKLERYWKLYLYCFLSKMKLISYYNIQLIYIGVYHYGSHMFFQFFRVNVRNLRELTNHDNLYPIYKKKQYNICSSLYVRVYQVTCNSVHNSFEYIYVGNLVCIFWITLAL